MIDPLAIKVASHGDNEDPPTMQQAWPNVLVALELDLKLDAHNIDVNWTFGRRFGSTGLDIPTYLREIAANSQNDTYRLKRIPQYGKRVSVKVNPEVAAFAIRLDRQRNWQFADRHVAISLAKNAPNNARVTNYGVLKANGQPGYDASNSSNTVDGGMLAYFVFDGTNLVNTGGSDTSYLSFNLHIDLLDKRGQDIVDRIPIVIDPDLRWPNGTQPDP